ncbi:HNH endonuclease [Nocardioides sp. NPDC058538]|uniref:HNH endonuclease n=1 Tax=Nocardioides sp. NPDC058538 TaxID=3346542 RepID=UPI00365FF8D4
MPTSHTEVFRGTGQPSRNPPGDFQIATATWAEAHHWIAWAQGGPTDLDNAALLCSHHHHRAHDAAYLHERLPNGEVRFTRRR